MQKLNIVQFFITKKNIHQLHDLAPNTTTTLLNNQNYNHNQNHDISNKKTESSKTHLRSPNLENQDSSAKRLKKHISEVTLNKKTLLCDSKRSNIKQPASPSSPRQDLATTFGAEIDTSDNMHCILCKTALKDSHAALRLHYKVIQVFLYSETRDFTRRDLGFCILDEIFR